MSSRAWQAVLDHLDEAAELAKLDPDVHRMLRTPLVTEIEEAGALRRLGPTIRRTLEHKRASGLGWVALARDGRALRRAQGRTLWLNGAQPNIRRLIETIGLHRLPAVRLDGPRPAFSS